MKKERVQYCDALRFIAIVSVIFIHVFADFRIGYFGSNEKAYAILTFLDCFTRMGVPIFFMLTGAFMLGSKKEEKYSDFLKRRMPKLIIPFFIFSVGYYVYMGLKNHTPFSVLDFFNRFTSQQIIYHLWFMYVIILFYLLIPFLKKFVQNLSKRELRTLILVIFISNILAVFTSISRAFDYQMFSSFLYSDKVRCLNYLFLGYYLYHYGIPKKYHKKIYFFGILSIFAMTILDVLFTVDFKNDAFLTAESAFPFIASTALFLFFKENYAKWKIPHFIQKFFSFTNPLIFYIYMVHVVIMELTRKYVYPFFPSGTFLTNFGYIFVEFSITFVLSYLLAYLFHYVYSKVEKALLQKNLS